jgi:hypothetical protein
MTWINKNPKKQHCSTQNLIRTRSVTRNFFLSNLPDPTRLNPNSTRPVRLPPLLKDECSSILILLEPLVADPRQWWVLYPVGWSEISLKNTYKINAGRAIYHYNRCQVEVQYCMQLRYHTNQDMWTVIWSIQLHTRHPRAYFVFHLLSWVMNKVGVSCKRLDQLRKHILQRLPMLCIMEKF